MQCYANNLLSVKYTHSNYFVVAKTCQKPYAKTPQKPAKNPLGPKIFCRGKNLL
jgi:hypothetical protein